MNSDPSVASYGTTRARRSTVTYPEFERAASSLLALGEKPGLQNVRKALGGGSPETIRQMLRRYWSDLAAQVGSPAQALQRLPPDIADLAEALWQRSLALASQRATLDDNAARERLEQIKRENEIRSHALNVKERTLSEREEISEKAQQELREHVATLVSIVRRNSETIAALQSSKEAAEARAEDYRNRFTQVIAKAVTKNQEAAQSRKPKGRKAVRKARKKAPSAHRTFRRRGAVRKLRR